MSDFDNESSLCSRMRTHLIHYCVCCFLVHRKFICLFIFSIHREMRYRLPQQRIQRRCLVSVRLPHQHRIVLRTLVERIVVLASSAKHHLWRRTPADIRHCPAKKSFEKCRQLRRKRLRRVHRNMAQHRMMRKRHVLRPLGISLRQNQSQLSQCRAELADQR